MKFRVHRVSWTQEKIDRFWNYFSNKAGSAEQYFGYLAGPSVARYLYVSGLLKCERMLDYGSGRGDFIKACLQYLKKDQQIYGLEFSNESADITNERFSGADSYGSTESITELPSRFADAYFDLICATEVIEHMDDQALTDMLTECSRLLGPGGYLFLTTPNDEKLEENEVICPDCGAVFHRWQHLRTWSPGSISRVLEKKGFETVKISTTRWGSPLIRLAASLGVLPRNSLFVLGRKPTNRSK